MTNGNTNDDYQLDELDLEDVPMVTCHITGDEIERETAQRLPRTQEIQYATIRIARWVTANPDVPVTESPWYRNPDDDNLFVWVADGIETVYCEGCGIIQDYDGDFNSELSMCEECASQYSYCYEHDRYYHEEESCYMCDEEEEESTSRLIHDYSFRPSPIFYIHRGGRTETVFMEPNGVSVTGFELEMEAQGCSVESGAQLAVDTYGESAYLKYDGSLNHGFEMVTHPMSLEYINTKFDFDGIKKLANIGMRSARTNTCGLHVHINKGFFNNRATSMYRFMSMFYANSEVWRRIAGRSNSSYAQWDIGEGDRLLRYTKTFGTGGNAYRDYNYDRYVAVNLQPSRTIELRFFKGTLRPETLKARLQAIHAVAEYSVITRNQINIKQASRWDTFRTWTEDNADKFGSFNTYANEKGV